MVDAKEPELDLAESSEIQQEVPLESLHELPKPEEPDPISIPQVDSPKSSPKLSPLPSQNVFQAPLNSLLSTLTHPTLENSFHQPLVALIKSNSHDLSASISNYRSISSDFLSESTIKLGTIDLNSDKLDWRSRSLQVSDKEIMITGGSKYPEQVLVINIDSLDIKRLPDLTVGRDLHAMTWIDHKPAVIGGADAGKEALRSVETFGKNEWDSVKPLNKKRYGLSAASVNNKAFVVGGAQDSFTEVTEIEVYSNYEWHEIHTKLPIGLLGVGLVVISNRLLMLGGFSKDKKNVSSVLGMDTETYEVVEKKPLDFPASFSQNLWKVSLGNIEGVTFRGAVVNYSLD